MTYCLIKMNNEEKELDILVSYYQYRYSVLSGGEYNNKYIISNIQISFCNEAIL